MTPDSFKLATSFGSPVGTIVHINQIRLYTDPTSRPAVPPDNLPSHFCIALPLGSLPDDSFPPINLTVSHAPTFALKPTPSPPEAINTIQATTPKALAFDDLTTDHLTDIYEDANIARVQYRRPNRTSKSTVSLPLLSSSNLFWLLCFSVIACSTGIGLMCDYNCSKGDYAFAPYQNCTMPDRVIEFRPAILPSDDRSGTDTVPLLIYR